MFLKVILVTSLLQSKRSNLESFFQVCFVNVDFSNRVLLVEVFSPEFFIFGSFEAGSSSRRPRSFVRLIMSTPSAFLQNLLGRPGPYFCSLISRLAILLTDKDAAKIDPH